MQTDKNTPDSIATWSRVCVREVLRWLSRSAVGARSTH
jgi:hypothetical protein